MIKEGSTDLRRQGIRVYVGFANSDASRNQQAMEWSAEENRFKLLVL